jgi:N-acetylglucosamine malate deacetylase 1
MELKFTEFDNLVIAPHPDDEVLGCSSILGHSTFVYFCGIEERYAEVDGVHRITTDERLKEIKDVASFFGYDYSANFTTSVNEYQLMPIKDALEGIINEIKPLSVFVSTPGFNQDHKTVYDAAMIALRPHDNNWYVRRVFEYESIHEFGWPHRALDVNYYVPIDITKKNAGMLKHASQNRIYRSATLLKAMAATRGAAANLEYAEAFKILRWVE